MSNILHNIPSKEWVRSASEIKAIAKSRKEVMMCVPQIVTYAVVEKGTGHKGEQR